MREQTGIIKIKGRIISKKNSKKISRNQHTGKPFVRSSDAFLKFEQDTLRLLSEEIRKGMVKPPYRVYYVFFVKGKLKIDTDNAQASINDIMQKARIIDDDENIISVSATKIREADEWGTYVLIETVDEDDLRDRFLDVFEKK